MVAQRPIKETQIQKAILDYLTVKRYFHWRNNSGAFKNDTGFYRFGTPGSPDIILIKHGFVWVLSRTPDLQASEQSKVTKWLAEHPLASSREEGAG